MEIHNSGLDGAIRRGSRSAQKHYKNIGLEKGSEREAQSTRKPVLLRPRKTQNRRNGCGRMKTLQKTASRNVRGAKKQGLYRNASSRRKTHKNEKRASNRYQNNDKMTISCQENASSRS